MPRNRILKQLIYGLFYVVFFVAVGYGVYAAFFRAVPTCFDNIKNQNEEDIDCGGPCETCALAHLLPLKSFAPQIFEVDGHATAVLRIQNENTNYGAVRFNYNLNFYDLNNNLIFRENDDSFIYPGESKVIIKPALDIDFKNVFRGEVVIHKESIVWRVAVEFIKPQLELQKVSTEIKNGQVVVSGSIQNKGSSEIVDAAVGAIILKFDGLPMNASKTVVSRIPAFGVGTFKIFIPISSSEEKLVNTKTTQVSWEVKE